MEETVDRTPKPMEQYVHFKGGRYQVLNLAEMEDTGEILVIYQALYGEGRIYARPLRSFVSEVDRAQYPDAAQYWRFLRVVPPEDPFPVPDECAPPGNPDASEAGADIPKSAAADRGAAQADAPETAADEPAVAPEVLRFLDAQTAQEKLEILIAARGTLTDEMIDTMAFALGIEVEPGPMDSRYLDLKECLLTISRYEMDRNRFRSSLQ